jgi:hypothetical protein
MTTFLATGDSITMGATLANPSLNYAKQVSDALAFSNYINTAVSGCTSTQLRNNLASMVLNQNPTHCMLMIGINDIYVGKQNGTTLTTMQNTYYDNMKYIISMILNAGVKLTVLSSVCSLRGGEQICLKEFAKTLERLKGEFLFNYIDITARSLFVYNNLSAGQWDIYYSDSTHPNQNGHNVIKTWIMLTQIK